MKKWKSMVLGALLGTTLVLTGCGSEKAVSTQAPLVKTIVAGGETAAEKTTFSGTVHGYYESPLGFQVGGRIVERYVSAGDRVSQGQALFKVDSKDAEEAAAQAESQVVAAQAEYNLARSTLARYESLHEAEAISDLAMDQTRNQYELAEAQLNQAKAASARAQNNLGFTLLTADRDGVIGSTMYEVGQVVSEGTPVVQIVDDSRLDVYVSLTEKQKGQYAPGMPCQVTFWAIPGLTVNGVVREIAASPNTSTGTYDAKITLDGRPDKVAVGMTAEVKFETDGPADAITVPLTALATQSSDPSLWIVKDGKAHLVHVKTGQYGKDTVQILSGIQKGDRVVTAGSRRLSEGEEVRI
jgi:multidrug efflux system membrane fusion protein